MSADVELIKRGLEIQQLHGSTRAGTPQGDRDWNERKKQRKESVVNAQRCGLRDVVSKGHG